MTALLTPEAGDPVALAPEVTPIDWAKPQREYEEQRRAHKLRYPDKTVADIESAEEAAPFVAGASELCPRCLGTGTVDLQAADMVFRITCPICSGQATVRLVAPVGGKVSA